MEYTKLYIRPLGDGFVIVIIKQDRKPKNNFKKRVFHRTNRVFWNQRSPKKKSKLSSKMTNISLF
jgi:hypothetical protein